MWNRVWLVNSGMLMLVPSAVGLRWIHQYYVRYNYFPAIYVYCDVPGSEVKWDKEVFSWSIPQLTFRKKLSRWENSTCRSGTDIGDLGWISITDPTMDLAPRAWNLLARNPLARNPAARNPAARNPLGRKARPRSSLSRNNQPEIALPISNTP